MESSKTKTPNDTCDRLVIATDSIYQDRDAVIEDRFQLSSNTTSEK